MGFRELFLLLAIIGLAHPYVVANSQDAMDACSAISYANARGEEAYLVYPNVDLFVASGQIGARGNILLISPSNKEMISGLGGMLRSNGNSVDTLSSTGQQLNLELASRSGVKKFIVLDPAYGYDFVSVIAYAKATGSYILFANASTASEVASFISRAGPNAVLLYGSLDEEVKSAVSGAYPGAQEISTGDKYDDNIQMLRKYFSQYPEKHDVLFADGTELEASIITAELPTVLVSTIIPDQTYEFMLESARSKQVLAGTLIGVVNLDPVYDMMKKVNSNGLERNLTVYVKFGQATGRGGSPGPLSVFPLPSPAPSVSLVSASYNPSIGAFELAYANTGNAPAFVKSSIAVLLGGSQIGSVGDEEPYPIRRGEVKGMRYPFPNPGEGQLSINDTTYYGLSKYSFDKGFIKYMDVGRISFVDQSSLLLSDASYSSWEDKLTVKVRNNGERDAFYRLAVSYVNDEGLTVYEEEKVRNLSAGRNEIITLTGVIQLPQEKADRTAMNVTATYGAREAFLEKQASTEVRIEGFPWWILLVLLLIILVIAYWYYRKKKGEKKEEQKEEPVHKKAKKK